MENAGITHQVIKNPIAGLARLFLHGTGWLFALPVFGDVFDVMAGKFGCDPAGLVSGGLAQTMVNRNGDHAPALCLTPVMGQQYKRHAVGPARDTNKDFRGGFKRGERHHQSIKGNGVQWRSTGRRVLIF